MLGVPNHRFPSARAHDFATVPRANIPRSSFNRSHSHKTAFDAGYLIPVMVDEILPGDTIKLGVNIFARLGTPLVPVMDNMYCDYFAFFVPNRLVWTNFVKFMGEQDNPSDSISYTVPQMPSTATTGYAVGSLYDYLGLPTGVATSYNHNALPTRCYNLIFNKWFRDENLQNSVVVDLDDGPDAPSDYVLLKRSKRFDYFTSCLPYPQKGNTTVAMPLGTDAPVLGIGKRTTVYPDANRTVYEADGTTTVYANAQLMGTAANDNEFYVRGTNATTGYPNIIVDLSAATGATINSLRQSIMLQQFLERDSRVGTRYTELVLSHFGVTNPDFRLQRPELILTGSTPVNIAPVPQTSSTDATSPQGFLSATGTLMASSGQATKSFTEHGWLMVLAMVRADLSYQQGLNRMWSRSTRYDYFWPEFAHLGEQAVLNKEIYCDGSANDSLTFGYIPRYDEYRHFPNRISGLLRSQAASTLDIWHLAHKFTSLPSLNATFITESADTNIDRVIATPTKPQFIADCYFKYIHTRPMPTYSVPGLGARL